MSKRIQADWQVLDSLEDNSNQCCVDYFLRPDASYGFEVFRRASEDQGLWQPLSHYSVLSFADVEDCVNESCRRFEWIAEHSSLHDVTNYCEMLKSKVDLSSL